MSDAALKLLEQIRALPDDDRRELVAELWEEPPATDDEIDALHDDPDFQAMLDERLREVEEHPESLVDGDEVLAEGRRRLREKRG